MVRTDHPYVKGKTQESSHRPLYKGMRGNRIAKGDWTKLGSMFYNFALNEGNEVIETLGKTPQKQQKYRKL